MEGLTVRWDRLLLGLVLLALLGWPVVSHLLHPRPSSRANFDRIREGMTEKEVEAILGPPGWHTNRPVLVPMSGVLFRCWWIEDDAVITIEFGPKEWTRSTPPFEEWEVGHKDYGELPPEPFFARLFRQLPSWPATPKPSPPTWRSWNGRT